MNRYQFQVVTYYILHRQKQYRRACRDTRFLRYSLRSELVHTFVYLHSNALAHSYFERRKCLIIIHGIIKVLANSRGVCVISCHFCLSAWSLTEQSSILARLLCGVEQRFCDSEMRFFKSFTRKWCLSSRMLDSNFRNDSLNQSQASGSKSTTV